MCVEKRSLILASSAASAWHYARMHTRAHMPARCAAAFAATYCGDATASQSAGGKSNGVMSKYVYAAGFWNVFCFQPRSSENCRRGPATVADMDADASSAAAAIAGTIARAQLGTGAIEMDMCARRSGTSGVARVSARESLNATHGAS